MAFPVRVSKRMRAKTLAFLHGMARDGIVVGLTHRQIAVAIDRCPAYVGFAVADLERDGFLRIEFARHRETRYLLTPLTPATQ